jgi:hypothetical protein
MVRRLENEVVELRQSFDARSEISNSTTSEGSIDSYNSSILQHNTVINSTLKIQPEKFGTKSKYDTLLMKFSQKSKPTSKKESISN